MLRSVSIRATDMAFSFCEVLFLGFEFVFVATVVAVPSVRIHSEMVEPRESLGTTGTHNSTPRPFILHKRVNQVSGSHSSFLELYALFFRSG